MSKYLFIILSFCFFISTDSFSQTEKRSFDSGKIKKYKTSEDYDYFKRLYGDQPEQAQNSSGRPVRKKHSSNSSSSRPVGNISFSFMGLGSFAWIIVAIFIVALIVVIVMIAMNADGGSGIRSEVLHTNTQDIEDELDEDDIDKNDFDHLIQKAKDRGNYRLAIRLMFLKSLQSLDEKQLISYQKNKTNYEYSFEIKSNKIQPLFLKASDVFSWVWYGNYDVDLGLYNELEPEFNLLIKSIE